MTTFGPPTSARQGLPPVAKVGVWAAVALAIGMAAFVTTYGTISPCEAVYHKVRGILNQYVMELSRKDSGKLGQPIAYMLGIKLLEAMPIEAIIDQKITGKFGTPTPLTCTAALFSIDWDSQRHEIINDAAQPQH